MTPPPGAAPPDADIEDAESGRIVDIVLDDGGEGRWSPEVEQERRVAVFDLLEANSFAPADAPPGPYAVRLSVAGGRLDMRVRAAAGGADAGRIVVPLSGLRRVVRDYFTVCENYFAAIRAAPPSRIEALDMGRRAVHDEGAELLRAALAGRVRIDGATARRLFTLVCALHLRGRAPGR